MRFVFPLLAALVFSASLASAQTPSFAEFDRKAKAGERLTVSFFGASLTWGSNASDQGTTSYRARIAQRLEAKYPDAHFTFRDGAIGGTGSQIAVFRLERDALRYKPDLLFLDFTANDDIYSDHPESLASYESLIRRTLQQGVPVVQVIFPFQWNVQNVTQEQIDSYKRLVAHKELSAYYNTAVGDAVSLIFQKIESGETTVKDVWPIDGVHPHDVGYAYFADAAWDALEGAIAEGRECTIPAEMKYAGTYMAWKRQLVSELGLPEAWKTGLANVNGRFYDFQPSRWLDEITVATNGAPALEFVFRGSTIILWGETSLDCARLLVVVDGHLMDNPHYNPKRDTLSSYVYDCGRQGRTIGGPGYLNLPLFSNLENPDDEHTLLLIPLFDASNPKSEIRIESLCVAGGKDPAIWAAK
ncbi:MAG: SGNH/GDSL hydrolase family protein [Kiritimatiellia bacterium]|jgi:lysophospholipase L1-like esterase